MIGKEKSSIELKHKMLTTFLFIGNTESIPKSRVTFICIHNKYSKQILQTFNQEQGNIKRKETTEFLITV